MPHSNYATVKQFSRVNPAFSEASLRYLIFNSKTNGLDKSGAILRVGRKILIDETEFFNWIKSSNDLNY